MQLAEIYFLKFVQYVLLMLWPLRGMYFDFCRLYPSFTQPAVGPVISLLLTSTVLPVRACLSIWLERFRVSQKWDDRGPLRIFNSSLFDLKSFFSFSAVFLLLFSKHCALTTFYSLIKKKIRISSYIMKFWLEQYQSHIWLTASSYMAKFFAHFLIK
jgi:hypothetical protein